MDRKIEILLITDLELIISLCNTLFDRRDYQVTVAGNGTEGLSLINAKSFDCLLISQDLPEPYTAFDIVKIVGDEHQAPNIYLLTEDKIKQKTKGNPPVLYITAEDTAWYERIVSDLQISALAKKQNTDILIEDDNFVYSLFDSVPVGLYRISPSGDFLDVNRTFLLIFDAPTRESLLVDNYFYLFRHTEDKENWLDIMNRDGMVRGLVTEFERYDGQNIWIRDNARPVYDENHNLLYFDGAVENVTLQKQHEEKLTFLATHDILTGLPNRNFFNDQASLTMSQARYNGDFLAFMIFDLDYFKRINETFGTKVGDKLLQEVAQRVRTQLRKSDLVSRLGGDKFMILISSIRGRRDALSVAEKISGAFKEPYVVGDIEIPITASIGISFYPEHGEDISTLIKKAEIAVYSVKNTERGGYQIYSESLQTSSSKKNGQTRILRR